MHGEERGSVDRGHNVPGSRLVDSDSKREANERDLMLYGSYSLDPESRSTVLEAIPEVCLHYGWQLLAAHVRTNHVHVVPEAEVKHEKILNALKAYASRALNRSGSPRKRWARHGSTRWLFKDAEVRAAIKYVVDEQGEPMAVCGGRVSLTCTNRLLSVRGSEAARYTGRARFAGYPRKTVDGDVSAARLDGIQQAAIATTPNNPHTAPIVTGSNAGTSYSEACNNRPAAHAPPMPIAAPTPASRIPSPITSRITRAPSAPSASLIPISCLRNATL